ncbi:MAG: membrane protein insertion efficiency factor YidD [Ruminococcus sp.]|nr:membrane protein insertion efficiency factor YidD [Ruminococcus sp.]
MKYLAMGLIRLYQRFISPLTGAHCRYYPTCSQYAMQSYKKHGFVKGTILSVRRILRCNPLFKGGVDPVPEKFTLIRIKERGKRKPRN